MLVFSYGIPKSGSTLAFELAKAVARLGGHRQPLLPRPLLPGGHKVNFAQALDPAALRALAVAAEGRIRIVKTHACPGPEWAAEYRALAARGLASAHVNWRDPRDICLSLLDAGRLARSRGESAFAEFVTLEDAVAGVRRYLGEHAVWAALPRTLQLDYATCAFRMDAAIGAIKADFGIACPNWAVRLWVQRFAFTYRNKAVPARHLSELTSEQAAHLAHSFAPWLPPGA
ncbi:hypothetical protein [Falsiroseomonas selenitidurans]|uniref:Sulfotransferase family protein n=1 Tax=Falsiroseomonas selenitidurans TaxID=2716335 RepID=A0ABX1E269_9PROT|nr:hypothetical protein [Falsiroseomonas selenitidurans]NKC29918.1 hypothetical protein [Falsiroseomonas selenitidurans]